jgi:hypothetical protein
MTGARISSPLSRGDRGETEPGPRLHRRIRAMAFAAACAALGGCAGPDRPQPTEARYVERAPSEANAATTRDAFGEPHVERFDFAPLSGDSYDVAWAQPPRKLEWSDVKLYYIDIRLAEPAPRDTVFYFTVNNDVAAWFDDDLGASTVTIREGNRRPGPQDQRAPTSSDSAAAPIGAPDFATAGFYLGCTKEGRVKGSSGKNGNVANVYVEFVSSTNPSITWDDDIRGVGPHNAGNPQSYRHEVRCVATETVGSSTPPTDTPPRACSYRGDCGEGQWCVNGVCRPPPFPRGCRGVGDCPENSICRAVRNTGGAVEILGPCWDPDTTLGYTCQCVPY